MILGYIGVAILLFSYLVLLTKHERYFFIIDAFASLILTIHAVLINDVPFIIVNGVIMCVLGYKASKIKYSVGYKKSKR